MDKTLLLNMFIFHQGFLFNIKVNLPEKLSQFFGGECGCVCTCVYVHVYLYYKKKTHLGFWLASKRRDWEKRKMLHWLKSDSERWTNLTESHDSSVLTEIGQANFL